METWLAQGAQLIAPASALAGVALGALLSGRREHRQWLRERRFEAYTAINLAARTLLWRGDDIGRDDGTDTLADQVGRVRTAMFDLRQAVATVDVIGTPGSITAARTLKDALANEPFVYFTSLQGPQDDDSSIVSQARAALGEYQAAIRKEL